MSADICESSDSPDMSYRILPDISTRFPFTGTITYNSTSVKVGIKKISNFQKEKLPEIYRVRKVDYFKPPSHKMRTTLFIQVIP